MNPTCEEFKAISQPFVTGTTRIEASAGTGKTFSISYLVLRLVVEQGLKIEEILTVTFTKAATEELKERIRGQLYLARKAYSEPSEDSTLNDWIETRQDSVEDDKARLNEALANIDQAGIFTIHGFCQRVLTEFPLESQQAFKLELSQDLSDIQLQVVHDFWRQTVYPMPPAHAHLLKQVVASPKALYEWVKATQVEPAQLVPEPQDLDVIWSALDTHTVALEQWLAEQGERVFAWLESLQNADLLKATGQDVVETWPNAYMDVLSQESFYGLLNGQKFRGAAGTERKEKHWAEFVAEYSPPMISAEQLLNAQGALESSFKKACRDFYRVELSRQQAQQGQMGFDDLVSNLAQVLDDETQKQHIKSAMQARFKAALIDEFQDTDVNQWRIFKAFFATDTHYLYLIGDPKQAIYKFRGADIETYLDAARSAQIKLTLAHNWRSRPNLVNATNALFEQVEQPFQKEGLEFHPVKAGLKDEQDQAVEQQPLRMWQWPESVDKLSAPEQADWVRANVCRDILAQLNCGERTPGDFAVLVRSHQTAEQYLKALAELNIPAVVKSKKTVFQTAEAESLRRVMQAVLQPNRVALAQEALSEPMFGLDAVEYFESVQDGNERLEMWMLAFKQAHDDWHKKGFMPALMPLLESQGAFEQLNHYPNAERRLTNLLHALEVLQMRVLEDGLTPTQTLSALEKAMQGGANEDAELRLESDAKAVQIVTIHSSKGLQYPVVYCPDLYKAVGFSSKEKARKVKVNGVWQISADKAGKEQLKKAAEADMHQEDLRLAYVALTRAESSCVVVMPPEFEKGQSSLKSLLPKGVPEHENIAVETLVPPAEIQLSRYEMTDADLDFERLMHFNRRLDIRYRLTSYSAISKGILQEEEASKADDEQVETTQAPEIVQVAKNPLPKGAHFGNLLHDILEYRDFAELAKEVDDKLVLSLCRKHGVNEMIQSGKDESLKPDLYAHFKALIQHAVTARIDEAFALQDLQSHQVLKEMPFYMALNESNTTALNHAMQTLGEAIPYQPLKYRDLVGHMNGFVDLIAEFDGRFYVMDYKSNDLQGDYSQAHLHEKMKQANYGLQGVIYSLALHRYLRSRVVDYDFDRHFGGVRYLFVRGMSANEFEQGVYRFNPPKALIDELDELFSGDAK